MRCVGSAGEMAQRVGAIRSAGMASLLALIVGCPQTEEDRPRPAGAGDEAGDLREAQVMLSPICEACVNCRDFVGLALPLPNQPGTELDTGRIKEARDGSIPGCRGQSPQVAAGGAGYRHRFPSEIISHCVWL